MRNREVQEASKLNVKPSNSKTRSRKLNRVFLCSKKKKRIKAPFDQWLGQQVFNLQKRDRNPHGAPNNTKEKVNKMNNIEVNLEASVSAAIQTAITRINM